MLHPKSHGRAGRDSEMRWTGDGGLGVDRWLRKRKLRATILERALELLTRRVNTQLKSPAAVQSPFGAPEEENVVAP